MLEGIVSYFYRSNAYASSRGRKFRWETKSESLKEDWWWEGQKLFRPIGLPDWLLLSQLSQNTSNTVVVDQDRYFPCYSLVGLVMPNMEMPISQPFMGL